MRIVKTLPICLTIFLAGCDDGQGQAAPAPPSAEPENVVAAREDARLRKAVATVLCGSGEDRAYALSRIVESPVNTGEDGEPDGEAVFDIASDIVKTGCSGS